MGRILEDTIVDFNIRGNFYRTFRYKVNIIKTTNPTQPYRHATFITDDIHNLLEFEGEQIDYTA